MKLIKPSFKIIEQYPGLLGIYKQIELAGRTCYKSEDKIPDKRYKTGFRNNPWTPQQARAVLPNALKTELVMTGFINDWKHFFELRCAPNAHPSARELAIPLSEEFVKKGLV